MFHLKMGTSELRCATFSLLPKVRPSIVFQDSKTGVVSAETFQTSSPLCRVMVENAHLQPVLLLQGMCRQADGPDPGSSSVLHPPRELDVWGLQLISQLVCLLLT